jgi:formylglycine-generating enzyme required for sulfatase activity
MKKLSLPDSSSYLRRIPAWPWITGGCIGVVGAGCIFIILILVVIPEQTLAPGEARVRDTDGMIQVYVPGGTFWMGSEEGDSNEQPVHSVTLDSFWIDQTEVTNAQFAAFLNDRGNQEENGVTWLNLRHSDSQIEQSGEVFQPLSGYANYPAVEVSWYGAAAYCQWAGGRLPTEAEWEYAACGPEEHIYPWGNTFDGARLNYCDVNCPLDHWRDTSYDDGYARSAPVGSYQDGASWVGALDMAGNVYEWVGDRYGPYARGRQVNPAGPSSGGTCVLRGGSWLDHFPEYTRCTYRFGAGPHYSNPGIGFRCVSSIGSDR